MRLAHLILAHNHPRQLERLVNRLSHPDADVYIHLDTKADMAEFAFLKDLPNVYFIKKRANMMWCKYSTIQGTLNGMEEILKTGIVYSHINLLSGNDYPLQSAEDIQRFLFDNPDKTYMWYDRIFNDWPEGQLRIHEYHFQDYPIPGVWRVTDFFNKYLPKRKMPRNLVAYGRSQWLTINPVCAAYVIKYIKRHYLIKHFFRMTWAVDEVFFQTILCNSPLKDTLVNDNLRHIRLNKEYRPVTYTIADGEELSTSGKFYARKFDGDQDSAIFDYLDNLAVLTQPLHA